MDDTFDPYPEGIYVYDNTFIGGGSSPDRLELKTLKVAMFGLTGSLPDILWDGIMNPAAKQPALCVNNGESLVVNVDAGNDFANVTTDMTQYGCELPKLSAIDLSHLEG
ncbi:hypothetical protein [Endozoicomonas lisbonensis]|uniref:hypothetical protein n=1 Tax=Endozoicomonas lisbonensis TaxID=3120522 RepID=UPI00339A7795